MSELTREKIYKSELIKAGATGNNNLERIRSLAGGGSDVGELSESQKNVFKAKDFNAFNFAKFGAFLKAKNFEDFDLIRGWQKYYEETGESNYTFARLNNMSLWLSRGWNGSSYENYYIYMGSQGSWSNNVKYYPEETTSLSLYDVLQSAEIERRKIPLYSHNQEFLWQSGTIFVNEKEIEIKDSEYVALWERVDVPKYTSLDINGKLAGKSLNVTWLLDNLPESVLEDGNLALGAVSNEFFQKNIFAFSLNNINGAVFGQSVELSATPRNLREALENNKTLIEAVQAPQIVYTNDGVDLGIRTHNLTSVDDDGVCYYFDFSELDSILTSGQ